MDGSFTLRMAHPIAGQLIANLRERIIGGELVPGIRLSEQEVADSYGLSRQPVREAFIRLAAEGLVEIRPQRGTFVRKISISNVEVSRFMREAVEADVVRLAASRAASDGIADLRAQLAQQAEAAAGDAGAFIQLDDRFHQTIAEIAGVADAWAHLQPIKMHLDRVRHLTAAEFPVSRLVGEHRGVVEAIAARAPDAAEKALRRHLRGVLEDLPQIVAAQPQYFEIGPDFAGPTTLPKGRNR